MKFILCILFIKNNFVILGVIIFNIFLDMIELNDSEDIVLVNDVSKNVFLSILIISSSKLFVLVIISVIINKFENNLFIVVISILNIMEGNILM